jgi:DNA polymerase III delta prime subunit
MQTLTYTFYFISTAQTTSVHALARQLLGSAYSNGVLELNASDSRGIDVSDVTLLATRLSFACVFGRVLSADT